MSKQKELRHSEARGGPTRNLVQEITQNGGYLDMEHPWVKVLIMMNKLGIKLNKPHKKIRTRFKI